MTERDDPIREEILGQEVAFYVGKRGEDAPKLPAGKLCNARKTKTLDQIRELDKYDVAMIEPDVEELSGNDTIFVGYCNHWAGHKLEGYPDEYDGPKRCWIHHAPGNDLGERSHVRHNLTSDPKKYHDSLDQAERDFVLDVSATIEDRLREKRGDIDLLDRVMARRIATRIHIASEAADYISDSSIVQQRFEDGDAYDEENPLLGNLRRYDASIIDDLRKLGVIDDPGSEAADALGVIAQWSESAKKRDENSR